MAIKYERFSKKNSYGNKKSFLLYKFIVIIVISNINVKSFFNQYLLVLAFNK